MCREIKSLTAGDSGRINYDNRVCEVSDTQLLKQDIYSDITSYKASISYRSSVLVTGVMLAQKCENQRQGRCVLCRKSSGSKAHVI